MAAQFLPSILDRFSKKYYKLLFLVLAFLALFFVPKAFYRFRNVSPRLPPLFDEYHLRELALPQHNPDLLYPEGRTGKYLWISGHTHDAGWGNILQEHVMNGLLTYYSGRSFVFDNYTWSRDGPYSEFNGHLIPSQIPMTAFISGPLAGGPFAPGDDTPRSVAKKYYDVVCPEAHLLDRHALRATLPPDYSAATVINAWLKMIKETPDRCVEIDENIFDIWIFGSERLVDAMPMLFRSPIITLFRWSPLVTDAFQRNAALLVSRGLPRTSSSDPYAPINGLLALHVRRGDFEGHCQHLARWRSDWSGFNKLPELIDRWNKPPVDENDEMYPDGKAAYARSCYPTIDQIVERVEEIRQTDDGRWLKNIFIMTNGKREWVEELKLALWKRRNWRRIGSSRDMTLSWEQKHVAGAVDTLIGQRADVFIGNGWSSLTGNVVMFRTARGLEPGRTRFW